MTFVILYDFVEGNSLYNRSHLVTQSLAEEDANELNLITGTRCINAEEIPLQGGKHNWENWDDPYFDAEDVSDKTPGDAKDAQSFTYILPTR